jgi:TrmH family RNA methyltransferase
LSFGIDGVVLDSGCCSIYNSKVIRSSMGAIFYQPMLLTETNWLMDRKEEIIETTNKGEISLYNYSFPSSPFILVLGNEANGVSNSISNLSSKKIYIPMKPGMESINVAIAAGIFLYKISMS